MLGMQAGEIAQIGQDHLDGIFGLQGCLVIVHYKVETGVQDEYGNPVSATWTSFKTKAQANPILRRAMEELPLEDGKTHYKQMGDYSLTFALCVGLQTTWPVDRTFNKTALTFNDKPGLWFEIQDNSGNALLSLEPETKPAFGANPRTGGYLVANTRFVQEVFCRPKT